MTLSDLASLGSFVSGLAVLVSLIFLYFQLRQLNRQTLQTEKHQQSIVQMESASRDTAHLNFLADPAVIEGLMKVMRGQPDLTLEQYFQSFFAMHASFYSWEGSFFQHRQKLLDDESFESNVAQMKTALANPGWRVMFRGQRMMYARVFVDFVEELMDEVQIVDPPSDASLASWHKDFAAELTRKAAK
jgi:hypothetical protein